MPEETARPSADHARPGGSTASSEVPTLGAKRVTAGRLSAHPTRFVETTILSNQRFWFCGDPEFQ